MLSPDHRPIELRQTNCRHHPRTMRVDHGFVIHDHGDLRLQRGYDGPKSMHSIKSNVLLNANWTSCIDCSMREGSSRRSTYKAMSLYYTQSVGLSKSFP